MGEVRFRTVGDSALTVEFAQRIAPEVNAQVRRLAGELARRPVVGVTDWIPAFCSLLVCYDPLRLTEEELKAQLSVRLSGQSEVAGEPVRTVEIPVCYGRYFGPDLRLVAEHAGLTPQETVRLHCSRDYPIYMLGFLPGFAYLGGLEKRLHMPRRKVPRAAIPAGSVGIGGEQTGIYPLASPGGWQLIGRTPLRVYDPEREEPFLYRAGDWIRFVPIDVDEYYKLHRDCEAGRFQPVIHKGPAPFPVGTEVEV